MIDYTSRGGRRGSPAGTIEPAPERDPASVAPPADAPTSDAFRERPAAPDPASGSSRSPRDPRGWRSPGAGGDDPRQVSPRRPQDAPPRRAAPEYGRPAPAPGRAWGRPDAAEARPRGAGAGRSDGSGRSGGSDGRGESAGRGRARGGDGAASGSGGGVSAGARQGGRRSPR